MKLLSRKRFLEKVEGLENGEFIEVVYIDRKPDIDDIPLTQSQPFYFNCQREGNWLDVYGHLQHMGTDTRPRFFAQGNKAIPRSNIYDIRRLTVREEVTV